MFQLHVRTIILKLSTSTFERKQLGIVIIQEAWSLWQQIFKKLRSKKTMVYKNYFSNFDNEICSCSLIKFAGYKLNYNMLEISRNKVS